LLGIHPVHFCLTHLQISDLNQAIVELLQLLVLEGFFPYPFFIPTFHNSGKCARIIEVVLVHHLIIVSEDLEGGFGILPLALGE
jgi:hypothetical protein